jgi:hypothetical protein
MLNEQSVRDQLKEVRAALGKLDAERKALEAIVTSLVTWLDLHTDVGGTQLPLEAQVAAPTNGKTNGKTRSKSKPLFTTLGTIALKAAVKRVMRNRENEPIETEQILAKALEMGAQTNADEPLKVVEWILYDLMKKGEPIRRLAPHVYVYTKKPPANEVPPPAPERVSTWPA